MPRVAAAAVFVLMGGLLGGCHKLSTPDRFVFTGALNDYLAQRGHFCLGMYSWPIVVADDEFTAGTRFAVQLPELEKLGLLSHEDVHADIQGADGKVVTHNGQRFNLTSEGQQYYLHVPIVVQSTAVNRVVHPADLCAATLTLDTIAGWEPPRTYNGATRTSVLYTYHIDPAPWARSAEVRRVFPMLDRVIVGEGKLQLREGFTLTPKGWVADELLPQS